LGILKGAPQVFISGFDAITGALTYTPNPNFNGPDSFTFKVNDGTVDSAPATVSLTVTAVNHAPVANNQSVTVTEDTPQAIVLSGSDVDGNALIFSIVIGPTNGVISGFNANTGALTYTPNPNFNGPDSFTFIPYTTLFRSAPATVSLTVTAVNDAPVANNQSVTVTEDTPQAIVLSGSDVESDPLTFTIVNGPTNGVISGFDAITGASIYTLNCNFHRPDRFTFKVNDGT